MRIPFTKMHGAGNDFVIIDARTQAFILSDELICRMADRHRGIGFDQLLVIDASSQRDVQAAYRIFNADASKALQCGNGARCLIAWLAHELNISTINLKSPCGFSEGTVQDNGLVRVNMGAPVFAPARIPFITEIEQMTYQLKVVESLCEISVVSMGNPHAVLEVTDIKSAPLDTLGRGISAHVQFPQQVNVGFAMVHDAHHIDLRVYERGVGETQACGSGACAAVAALIRRKRVQSPVEVQLPGGVLTIEWPDPYGALWMTGPTKRVFEGVWIDEY